MPRILIVDDDVLIINLLKMALRGKDCIISESLSAEDAVRKMRSSTYDLLITDIGLPGLDGGELLNLCTKDFPETEIIIMTGNPNYEDAVKFVKKGAFHYIVKPFGIRAILAAIDESLEHGARRSKKTLDGSAPFSEKDIPSGYKIIRSIGSGAMGEVFLVEKDGTPYAMKILSHEKNDPMLSFKRTQRFSREAEALLMIKHANVVRIFEYNISVDAEARPSYIIMEYVPGGNLSGKIKEGVWTLKEKISAIRQIASALSAIHRHGILHRDIKPENILVAEDSMVKVSDFGIARIMNSSLTLTVDTMGSPAYMSPESLDSSKNIDARSDIFSLGILSYELLTDSRPFDAEGYFEVMTNIKTSHPVPPLKLNSSIPPEMNSIIMKMLEKKAVDRFQTANEVAEAIDERVKVCSTFSSL